VVSGDTLSEIAVKFKTTVKQLQTLNHLIDVDKLKHWSGAKNHRHRNANHRT
jgi:LysM repeat protein